MRQGIYDYLQKSELKAERLWHVVEGAIDRSRLLRRNVELEATLDAFHAAFDLEENQ